MVSGTSWPGGDPFLQRQNEPSLAVSTRNSLHLLAGANDYRTVDLPGNANDIVTGDAWLGVFTSYDGGATWRSTLLPGYPQEFDSDSPLHGYDAAADPTVRSGTNGLFYYSGIAFDRDTPVLLAKRGLKPTEQLAGVGSTSSSVFVARFIDNNNRENGEPIAHLGTTVVATNQSDQGVFLDKPWLAVDMPRKTPGTCTITQTFDGSPVTQSLPAGNLYVAYTAFSQDASGLRGRIYFSRSTNCGETWSKPGEISAGHRLNQGVTMALDPRTGTIYVAWRRFAWPQGSSTPTQTDAILLTRSLDGGRSFKPAQVVATDIGLFDQSTTDKRFRTNSYPTMAVDRNGYVHIAWSQRDAGPGGDARVVRTQARYKSREKAVFIDVQDDDGTESPLAGETLPAFPAPVPVHNHGGRGHQLMPSMICTAGLLQIAYLDLREDHTWGEYTRAADGGWVETRMQTDERTDPATVGHVFNQWVDDQYPTTRRHTVDVWIAQAPAGVSPTFTAKRVSSYTTGSLPESTTVEQLQFNPPNLPLFKLGTNAFAGDYLDIGALAFELKGGKKWKQAKKDTTAGVLYVAFTDNRDVRGPKDGDWSNYTPPYSPALDPNGTFEAGSAPLPCNPQYPWRAGMRNQNIYLARVSQGLFVGVPGNAKPLGNFQRAFVIYVHNDTTALKTFRLSIPLQPAGGNASFLQFSALTQLDVSIPPRSSISRSVFLQSSDPRASVQVDVQEIKDGKVVAAADGGLQDNVVINPDTANPEITNPEITNPEITNPEITNAEVYNPEITNPDTVSADIVNPEITNPEITNPEITNPEIVNPEIVNFEIVNPEITNPEITNPEITNPEITNPEITNSSLTDTTWAITNNGNTTATFNVELLLRGQTQVPESIKTQLIVHKTYTTPLACNCRLTEQTHNVVVANIINPRFVPFDQNAPFDPTDGSVQNTTLWLAPGESARITLRVFDPDVTDAETLDAAADVAPEVWGGAVNTEDAAGGSQTPPSDIALASFFLQRPTDTPIGGYMSPTVSVRVQDNDANPVSGANVTLSLAVNPGGATLQGNVATTDTNGVAVFPGLWLNRLGAGNRLVASATKNGSTITTEVSAAFDVQPLVVTSTDDAGPGSLRQAIGNAEHNAGYADTISFSIAGPGTHTIALASALPVITDPITLDAATQPGYTGVPLIRLDGANAGSANGLDIRASNSLVQGFMVTRFSGVGIRVTNATAMSIAKNFVGTDGTSALGNGQAGIFVTNCSATQIIGNLISGNGVNGVSLNNGTTGTVITNNKVGTNAAGTTALGNTGDGIGIYGATGTTVADNVIAASTNNGIRLSAVTPIIHEVGAVIQHNWVGTNAALAAGLGNGHQGISVAASNSTTIGGSMPGTGNLVAGNGQGGIGLESASTGTQILGNVVSGNAGPGIGVIDSPSATIAGNLIGTNPAGTAGWANSGDGISVSGPTYTYILTIGGTGSGAGNVIAANGGSGVSITGGSPSIIQGNWIGTNRALASGLGNLGNGIAVAGISQIGGTAGGAGNVIAYNSGAGIVCQGGAEILSNSIFSNGGLGIDMGGAGTPSPHIDSAVDNGTETIVTGYVWSCCRMSPGEIPVVLQFFANAGCDAPGYGEGTALVGSVTVVTYGSNQTYATFAVHLPPGLEGQVLTATSTHPPQASLWGFTSEFSACVTVAASRVLWTRQFGGAAYTTAYCMVTDGSAVYLAGLTTGAFQGQTPSALQGSSDAYVRKVDLAGNEVWTRQFGIVSNYSPRGIAVDASGVYVAGYTAGALPGQSSSGGDDAFVRKYDLAGTELWTRQFGTAGDENVYAVVVDASGVYVAGYTGGTLPGQTSSGGYDAFVRKYDTSGNEVWTRQFGSGDMTEAYAISIDASGVYVAGYTYGALPGQTSSGGYDAFVRKYNTSGTELWTRQFGSIGSDFAYGAIAIDASGVYVSGTTSDVLPGQTSSGGTDAFVRKYDLAGTELWTRQFGTTTGDKAAAISADASGVYVAGYVGGALPGKTSSGGRDAFVRKYHPDGTELWTRQFGSADDEITHGVSVDASGVYVAGTTLGTLPGQTSCSGAYDGFVRKYDLAGSELWTRQFGTTALDAAYYNALDTSGVYVAGYTDGTLPGQTSSGGDDAFVRKVDLAGNEVWTSQFGSPGSDLAYGGIAIDASGVYVSGTTSDALPGQTSSGYEDAFVRKYDLAGNELWTRQFGTASYDWGSAISVGASGVYVVGYTAGTFPGQTSSGTWDTFVRKYDLDGTELWTRQFPTVSTSIRIGISVDGSGVYVAGSVLGALPGQTSSGGRDAFVRKYDLDGTELWTRQFGTDASDVAYCISVRTSGVYVAGISFGALPGQTSSGGSDTFVRKYDSSGAELWTRQFGSGGDDTPRGIFVDAWGVYVSGYTLGTLPGQVNIGGYDGFVRKYDLAGNEQWTYQFGTVTGGTVAEGISTDASGVYVTGFTSGALPGQTSSGGSDAFVMKLFK